MSHVSGAQAAVYTPHTQHVRLQKTRWSIPLVRG
jgi:hypothetical protein